MDACWAGMPPRSLARAALLISCSGLLPVLNGCRTNPHAQLYIDNVNAEKRQLEDQLYELQFKCEEQVDELERLRRQLDQLQGQTPGNSPPAGPAATSGKRSTGSGPSIPDLKPPKVEPGDSSEPPAGSPERSSDDLENLAPPELDLGTESDQRQARSDTQDAPAEQIEFEVVATPAASAPPTSGEDTASGAGSPGHGWLLKLRLIGRARELDASRSRLTVVALDPVARTRVARWEFAHDQVTQGRASGGSEITLPIPIASRTGVPERLHLFVRYWLDEQHWIESDRELNLEQAPLETARWTPRAPGRRLGGDAGEQRRTREPPASMARRSPPANAGETPHKPQWRPYR